jgi:hypothetical protein
VARQHRSFVLALSLVGAVSAAGCIEESPPPPPKHELEDAGYVPTDAAAPDLAPSGDGGAAETAPAGDGGIAAWTGTWMYVSGSAGVSCGGSLSLNGVEGYLLITEAEPGALTVLSDGCSFHFTLAGDTATKSPPTQACPKWEVPIIPEWTLTMRPDGAIDEKLGGPVTLGGEACTIAGRATLRHQ